MMGLDISLACVYDCKHLKFRCLEREVCLMGCGSGNQNWPFEYVVISYKMCILNHFIICHRILNRKLSMGFENMFRCVFY
jgi:hypothetical protein